METPRDENILPQTNFTQKYPTVNFFQTTVNTCAACTQHQHVIRFTHLYACMCTQDH